MQIINNLRYGGLVPVWGTGTIFHGTEMLYNINVGYESVTPEPSYTEVSYLKTTSLSSSTGYCYFDTGISTNQSSGTIKVKVGIMFLTYCQDVYFGHMGNGYNSQSDFYDFRVFWHRYYTLMFDCGNGRLQSFGGNLNTYYDIELNADFTNNTCSISLDGGQTIAASGTFENIPNNYHIFINMSPLKFKYMTIYKDNVCVFDGHAALDGSNKPCIYDEIAAEYIYAIGSNTSLLTYEV